MLLFTGATFPPPLSLRDDIFIFIRSFPEEWTNTCLFCEGKGMDGGRQSAKMEPLKKNEEEQKPATAQENT